MVSGRRPWRDCAFHVADEVVRIIRSADDWLALRRAMRDFSDEMGFRHFALLTHEDHRRPRPGQINLRDYPEGAVARIIGENRYRRDPVMRGCIFADSAFLWSELRDIITVDHQDRIAFELGQREGLNEGITIPSFRLGHCLGSCTFAGLKAARRAELLIGPAQMIGVLAFQRARRLAGPRTSRAPLPRLEPRLRDCVVLAGRGWRDKSIAHLLGLTHRTVESYIRDARRLFDARDRTELVAAAVLAGEVGIEELRPDQRP